MWSSSDSVAHFPSLQKVNPLGKIGFSTTETGRVYPTQVLGGRTLDATPSQSNFMGYPDPLADLMRKLRPVLYTVPGISVSFSGRVSRFRWPTAEPATKGGAETSKSSFFEPPDPWCKGSKDPNNRALEPKYYNINGIWALNLYYLGPWTLE